MRKAYVAGVGCLMLAALLCGLVSPAPAQAVGPVLNHCNASWTASPSTDVVAYRIYFSPTAGGVGVLVGTVTAPTVAWSCVVAAIGEGQKYATVTAVDLAGNESPRSNEFAFALDSMVPAAASNLKVQ